MPDPRPAAGVPGALLALLSVLAVVGPISMELYLPTLPDVQDGLAMSDTQAAWSLLGCLLGLAVGQVLWGPVADRWGRRPVVLVALVLWTAVTLGCAVADTAGLFVALRVCQGLVGACGLTISKAVLADRLPGDALSRPLARLMILTAAFTVLSPVIGGLLLSFTDWRGIFWILVAVGVVVTGWTVLRLPETRVPAEPTTDGVTGASLVGLLRQPTFLLPTLASALAFATIMVFVTFSPDVLRGDYELDGLQFGLVFALIAVAMVTGAQTAPRLTDRIAPARLVVVALATSMTAMTALTAIGAATDNHPPLALLAGLFIVSNVAIGAVLPLTAAVAMSATTGSAGTASGLVGGIQFGLGALVGLVVAPVHPGGVTATALTMVVTASVALLIWTRRRLTTPAQAAHSAIAARPV